MHTKIIATIGPSCDTEEMIIELAKAGMDIARINFSHATHEEYLKRQAWLKKASEVIGKEIKILADLQGPRMRVGKMPEEGLRLFGNHTIQFTTDPENHEAIFIDNPYLHQEISPGEPLYLANGDIECTVLAVAGSTITAKVIHGGILFSRKGVNTPQTKLSISGVTEKDIEDAKHVLEAGVDYIAISFVQRGSDLDPMKKLVGDKAKIISKIESAFALKYIDEIIQESDAIMIARGDLGIEVPREKVPFIQKHLIRHCKWHQTPSITATQMLISMVNHPYPTRAEVSDVTNAILDGTDAVMLSDETASGQYPVNAVEMMRRIVEEAESQIIDHHYSL